jgi:hypothetical protein
MRNGESVVVERIPARICNVCGDMVIGWQTSERLLRALSSPQNPRTFAPVYAFETIVA